MRSWIRKETMLRISITLVGLVSTERQFFVFCYSMSVFFVLNDVAINRNELQRISRCGSELPCSSE